jgi:type I restriction enzyme M protein
MPKKSDTKNIDFKETLWKTADKLRNQLDAADYKHIVLGLIFLKYISDSFENQKEKVKKIVSDPKSDFFVSEDPKQIEKEVNDRDYYTKDNIFWVSENARWEKIRSLAKQSNIGSIIDKNLVIIENENKQLKGKLNKIYGKSELDEGKLGELIDLISKIDFEDKDKKRDILGEVYEYFLGQFALAEGKKGGQFYTPRQVVKTLVKILSPYKGRVYDPCCGSGGMFVLSEEFVLSHGGSREDISIYGQESNPTTWRLASMNLTIRGMTGNLGKKNADTFMDDQHPDTKFDYILMNPFFNDSDWGGEKLQDDKRWIHGKPPTGNANYAWIQHVLWKLNEKGKAGIVLANNTMTAEKSEGIIRKSIINNDLIEVIITLPKKLFLNFKGSVCLWFLAKNKSKKNAKIKEKILFIDATDLGFLKKRNLKEFTDEDINKITNTVEKWRKGENYNDEINFCKSVSIKEIENKNYLLMPGVYIDYKSDVSNTDLKKEINNLINSNEKLDKELEISNKNLIKVIKDLQIDNDAE